MVIEIVRGMEGDDDVFCDAAAADYALGCADWPVVRFFGER